jgi:thioredoxin reductase (NADPH)
LLRICPICDAFEATGKRIAVVGSGEHGDREAQFLRTYSEGCTPMSQLAASLGAHRDSGALRVNPHQQTSVPGIYAAGDLVRGLNQVVVAAAEAAIAATDIHNHLRAQERVSH